MAEEIATPGEGQLKALITVAGNPVLSTPGGDKLDEVLPMLDAMISVDLWLNETTRHADVILPGLSAARAAAPRRSDPAFAVHSVANCSAPVFDPGDRPHEWEILIRLTGLCTGTPAEDVDVAAIDDGFFDYLAFTRGVDGAAIRKLYDHGGPERMLDLTLRTGPFGDRYGENPGGLTLDMLKANPNGIDFGPMVPQLPDILGTPDKKIRLAPPISARRPAPAGRAHGAPRRAAGAGEPPAPAVEQLVAAQRARADEGQGPVHAADPPRRCRALRRRRRRRRHGEIGGRRDQGARRDDRRDQTRRGVDAARLGPRQAGHPHVGGERLTGRQHQRAVPADVRRRAVGQRRAQRHPGDDHR